MMLAVLLLVILCVTVSSAADCPAGCSCLSPADAKAKGYDPCGGQLTLCGYDRAQQAMYCYGSPAQPTCPSDCECLSEAAAKEKFGTYAKCSDAVCGYEQTAAALIPRYCVKKAPAVAVTILTVTLVQAPACPTGCECMPEAQALQQPNVYVRCSDTPCSQVVTGSSIIKSYCYRKSQPVVCPQGCECMSEAKAKAVYGNYERCSETPCTTTAAGAAPAPEYCFRQKVTPSVCPAGCDCLSEATAKQNYGNYKKCSETVCGYDQTTAAQVPKYCIAKVEVPAATATPVAACPSGCSCMGVEDAKKMNYNYCNNVQTACGYDASQRQLFCFGPYTPPTCSYDPKANACMGSCSQGYSCGIVYSAKDDSGRVTTVCSCIPPPVSQCTYDKEKGCVGTCPNGGQCMKLGVTQSAASNAATPLCGCQIANCYFAYALDTCVGKCPLSGEACQLNTIYRNAVTGKTEYAECHCKGAEKIMGTITPVGTITSPAQPCGSDPVSGGCIGVCPANQICGSYDCTIDSSGRKICTNCRCIGCEFDQVSGSCRGHCPEEGTTCNCNEWTTDSAGKVGCRVESGCSCRRMCTPDAAGGCSGECPFGGNCAVINYITDKDGVARPTCGCGATGATPAATPTPSGKGIDVFRSIGDFFRNLFGWK